MNTSMISWLAAACLAAGSASAQLVYLEDYRSVSTGGFFWDNSGTLPGETYDPVYPDTDFGLFVGSQEMDYLGGTVECSAFQTSEIVSDGFFAMTGTASVEVTGPSDFPDGSVAEALSTASFGVSIDEPAIVRVSVDLGFSSSDPGAVSEYTSVRARIAERIGNGFTTYFRATTEDIGDAAGLSAYTVRLEPGEWLLQFAASLSVDEIDGTPYSESGSYSGTIEFLGTPCNGADFAAPFGVLDLRDISAWGQAFTSTDDIMNPSVDIDDSGFIDLLDIVGFVEAFTAGCE